MLRNRIQLTEDTPMTLNIMLHTVLECNQILRQQLIDIRAGDPYEIDDNHLEDRIFNIDSKSWTTTKPRQE